MDAEGIPCRRKPIVENGVLLSHVYDLQTGGLMGLSSTGNAKRGFDSLPVPGLSNIIVDTGSASWEELLEDMKHGLIVDQVIGGGQGNVLRGDFSVNVDVGYWVKDGRIAGRAKDIMVSGNAYQLLKQVRGVEKTARSIGSLRTPALLFPRISVAG